MKNRLCLAIILAGLTLGNPVQAEPGSGPEGRRLLSLPGLKAKAADELGAVLAGDDPRRSDEANREALQKCVNKLVGARDFDSFDLLCYSARKQRLLRRNGFLLVGDLYRDVETAFQAEKVPLGQSVQILEDWCKKRPTSATAKICLGQALISWAWEARGSRVASQVTPQGWRLFKERLVRAREVLGQAAKLAKDDVHPYVSLIQVGMGLQLPRATVRGYFDKAVAIDPVHSVLPYHYFAQALMPRWGGKPGEVDAMLDLAVRDTRKELGEAMYALAASDVIELPHARQELSIDWQRMKKGYEDFLKRHPGSDSPLRSYLSNAATFADRSCLEGLANRIHSGFPQMLLTARERSSLEERARMLCRQVEKRAHQAAHHTTTTRVLGAIVLTPKANPPQKPKEPPKQLDFANVFSQSATGEPLRKRAAKCPDTTIGGVCVARDAATGLYGYKDNLGSWRIAPTLYYASSFQDGIALIYETRRDAAKRKFVRGKCAYVNLAGQAVLGPWDGYRGTSIMSGYFLVRSPQGKEAFFNVQADPVEESVVPKPSQGWLRKWVESEGEPAERPMP